MFFDNFGDFFFCWKLTQILHLDIFLFKKTLPWHFFPNFRFPSLDYTSKKLWCLETFCVLHNYVVNNSNNNFINVSSKIAVSH